MFPRVSSHSLFLTSAWLLPPLNPTPSTKTVLSSPQPPGNLHCRDSEQLYLKKIILCAFIIFIICLALEHSFFSIANDHPERLTGRKARGLQTEEIACKCQTFLFLLSGRRKQSAIFFPSLYKFKRRFPLKFCVATTPGFT